jgi:hypothetical protein
MTDLTNGATNLIFTEVYNERICYRLGTNCCPKKISKNTLKKLKKKLTFQF